MLPALLGLRVSTAFLLTLLSASCEAQPGVVKRASIHGDQKAMADTSQIAAYVVDAFTDSKGNLWFGTIEKGVAYYNGRELAYFTMENGLPDNTVRSVAEDGAGNIWLATEGGLCRYDGFRFRAYTERQGLRRNSCWCLLADQDGKLWVGTMDGVSVFDGQSFTSFELPKPVGVAPKSALSPNCVRGIARDRSGNLWFATDGYGACRYDGKTFRYFTTADGLCTNSITSILADSAGQVWIASAHVSEATTKTDGASAPPNNGGLAMYDGLRMVKYPHLAGLANQDLYTLYGGMQGGIWIGTMHHGVYHYQHGRFRNFSTTEQGNTWRLCVQGITTDKAGTTWLACSGGLYKLTNGSIVNVRQNGPW